MFDNFQALDFAAFSIATVAVLVFIGLLCWNGYDDFRRGRK